MISSDKSIQGKNEDKFNRKRFAERISKVILSRNDCESVVFGISGKWGEGKSSLMEMIKESLTESGKRTSIVDFNPWIFPNEDALLSRFFDEIAHAIDSSLNSLHGKKKAKSLITKKERLVSLVKEHGKSLASLVGAAGLGEVVAKALPSVDLETLKSRIEEYLRESETQIIVFIDDLDRLQKDEITAIFRLVKLTACFPYTNYILAYDKEYISSAFSTYGDGSKESGERFLEKIVQIPLEVPLAQRSDLASFTLEQIYSLLENQEIMLEEVEKRRFESAFYSTILFQIKTPRQANRYKNTLAVVIPILEGEVNIVDLLIIEGIRLFFPTYFELIRSRPHFFVFHLDPTLAINPNHSWRQEIERDLEVAGITLPTELKKEIVKLLKRMFYQLEKHISNKPFPREFYQSQNSQKRIGTDKYFGRYLSYSVLSGDISDNEILDFIKNFRNFDEARLTEQMVRMISTSDGDTFINKVNGYKDYIPKEAAFQFSILLAKNGHLFPGHINSIGIYTGTSFVSFLICDILLGMFSLEEALMKLNDILRIAVPFEISIEVYKEINTRKDEAVLSDPLFESGFSRIKKTIVSRIKKEFEGSDYYIRYPLLSPSITAIWSNYDRSEFEDSIFYRFEKSVNKVNQFLLTFTSKGTQNNHENKGDLSERGYKILEDLIDIDRLGNLLLENYKLPFFEKPAFFVEKDPIEKANTEENAARQFYYFWKRSKAAEELL